MVFSDLLGRDCEISQFWHILQLTLQPAVAMEEGQGAGMKWKKGFFSMGSTWAEQTRSRPASSSAAAIFAHAAVTALVVVYDAHSRGHSLHLVFLLGSFS